jgi:hypothetical protein
MWVIALAALGLFVVLVVRAVNDDAEILRDWEHALSPWGLDVYRQLQERLDGESRMAEYAYRRAFEARAAGSPEEAVRLLEVGLQIVERTSPDMVTLLREMSVASRMAAAISPVEPLRPGTFRLPRLSTIALFAALAHQLLFSTAERFRLRAFVLQQGFSVTTRLLLRSTRRIRHQRQRATDPDWKRIAAARADLQALSSASLRTFQTLLTSLSAEQG